MRTKRGQRHAGFMPISIAAVIVVLVAALVALQIKGVTAAAGDRPPATKAEFLPAIAVVQDGTGVHPLVWDGVSFVLPPESTTTTTTTTTVKKQAPVRTRPSRDLRAASVEPAVVAPAGDGVWDRLAVCESASRWNLNSGNGFSGGLQFTAGTWRSYVADGKAYGLVGYPSAAWMASREQQIVVAERVRDGVPGSSGPYLNPQGYGAWPVCSRRMGVR